MKLLFLILSTLALFSQALGSLVEVFCDGRFNLFFGFSGDSLPRFIKQPFGGVKVFKEALYKDPEKQFLLWCEAEGDPKPT
jgi:hypothetical protein